METLNKEESDIKKQLADILLAVSWREISYQYFNQSASWLYHKLDADDFTSDEQMKLREALFDLSDRIRRAAEKIWLELGFIVPIKTQAAQWLLGAWPHSHRWGFFWGSLIFVPVLSRPETEKRSNELLMNLLDRL